MPTSFDDIMRIVQNQFAEDDNCKVLMWRGQADIDWPLHSSAYRRLALTEGDLRWYEEGLLERATHRGFRYHDGRRLSDFEFLARLQHHGAATRLVDFTRNMLVGLYFAASAHPEKAGLLLGLNTYFVGGYEGETEDRPYSVIMDGIKDLRHPQTWEPSVVSPRIAAQHAQFLYSVVSTDPKGSLYIKNSQGSHLAVAISPAFKGVARATLSAVYDIRHLTMFPDLDGFGYANSQRFIESADYRW